MYCRSNLKLLQLLHEDKGFCMKDPNEIGAKTTSTIYYY